MLPRCSLIPGRRAECSTERVIGDPSDCLSFKRDYQRLVLTKAAVADYLDCLNETSGHSPTSRDQAMAAFL